MVNIFDREVIDYFGNGLRDKFLYKDFIKNKPSTIAEFQYMFENWVNAYEQVREKFEDQNQHGKDKGTRRRTIRAVYQAKSEGQTTLLWP